MSSREQKNREHILNNVENFWIKSVLEDSLHGATMFALGMKMYPAAVDHPWRMVLQMPERPEYELPSDKPIIDIFDDLTGNLLILGNPGSGKTTILLQLTRELIARARQDWELPIPVVFNLSSWSQKQLPIQSWLVDELHTKYYVPMKVGTKLIQNGHILPMLDGLDEVESNLQWQCAEALNRFQTDCELGQMVVCSRQFDYRALKTKLKLAGAVMLLPLTREQIDQYLSDKSPQLQQILDEDAKLREITTTPLMLNIMLLAYQNTPSEPLEALESIEEQRRHIFDNYVHQMLNRRSANTTYSASQTLHYLRWLAFQMSDQGQSIFFVEDLQPAALLMGASYNIYRFLLAGTLGLISGFGIAVVATAFLTSWGWPQMNALLAGIAGGTGFGLCTATAVAFTRYRQFGLIFGAGAGIALGINFSARDLLSYGFRAGSPYILWDVLLGLVISIIGAAVGVLIFSERSAKIADRDKVHLIDSVRWSWSRALIGGTFFIGMLVFAEVVASVLSPYLGTAISPIIATGEMLALFAGLAISLSVGLTSDQMETRSSPNQGIYNSTKHAISIALLVGLGAAVIGFFVKIPFWLIGGWWSALAFSVMFVILCLIMFGGTAVLQHVFLRLILNRQGHIPQNLVKFLDYSAERIFLRKVGGGYIFVHRLLMDYFVQSYSKSWEKQKRPPGQIFTD